jgi:hypothetical protein
MARNLFVFTALVTLLAGVALVVALLITDSLLPGDIGFPLVMLFACSYGLAALPGLIITYIQFRPQSFKSARRPRARDQ